ncbi:hypothetical protein PPACK8108_LOCUS23921 [Phakopsora pachyrhizi]|uniref:Uncharacterized protein n=1 Tax=Phakopsora pachyrhizi TaxID=170000 RepID=A0AAV0BRN0_PHAPC|nr:hypothetical protein PPACK8108_LOCUS23921 [Phakopsora pachyrhizi]
MDGAIGKRAKIQSGWSKTTGAMDFFKESALVPQCDWEEAGGRVEKQEEEGGAFFVAGIEIKAIKPGAGVVELGFKATKGKLEEVKPEATGAGLEATEALAMKLELAWCYEHEGAKPEPDPELGQIARRPQEPGRRRFVGGQNKTPGEIFPGVQKSGQILIAALEVMATKGECLGLKEGRVYWKTQGIRRKDMDGAGNGMERLWWKIWAAREEKWMAPLKRGAKSSKTTGAMDL